MNSTFPDTPDGLRAARHYASTQSKQYNQSYGIEKMREYGRRILSVKMIPNDPAKRFGWETRCEPVNPTDPAWEI